MPKTSKNKLDEMIEKDDQFEQEEEIQDKIPAEELEEAPVEEEVKKEKPSEKKTVKKMEVVEGSKALMAKVKFIKNHEMLGPDGMEKYVKGGTGVFQRHIALLLSNRGIAVII